ncbi:MAG TPA: galactitol-1-phosphate 5-dehydrogenase [Candidatus Dormibacteraeota bacterium]|nr:galactitol-1-phosphate 5-dehydrogenase [Candidatus Dormibacteraeota bacterium]
MKALVLKQYKQFAYEEVPSPEPGPKEVLVSVRACGICGSDVHGMDGSTGRRRPPIIMGHEASGVIARTGSGVTEWHEGDRVTFDSTIYCGQCEFCRAGLINLCDQRRVLGVSCEDYRQQGAFAEFLAVPQHILYRLPERLAFEHAALTEPFSIALHAVKRTQVKASDSVVVLGAGMIGLAVLQVLVQIGCQTIIVLDISKERLALAQKLGATETLNSAEKTVLGELQQVTNGRGLDVSFEAVGITATVDLAIRSLRKGGTAVLVGNVAPKIEFPLQTAVTRELNILGSCASKGEYPECLELLSSGKVRADELISATVPLAEGAEWFDRLYKKDANLLKVVLVPEAKS